MDNFKDGPSDPFPLLWLWPNFIWRSGIRCRVVFTKITNPVLVIQGSYFSFQI